MYFVLRDHTGWWVAFFVARTCAFLVASFVGMLLVLSCLVYLGMPMLPDWLCNVVWGLLLCVIELTLGSRLLARERARFRRSLGH